MPRSQGRRRVNTGGVTFSPSHPKLPRQLFPRTGYDEDFHEPRTKLGNRRVSARRGRAGEDIRIFSNRVVSPEPASDTSPNRRIS